MSARRTIILFVLIAGILFSVYLPSQVDHWGKVDFFPYWSASKTMITGGNPYNEIDLFQIQVEVRPELENPSDVDPAMGPPWTMLLLSPLTWLDFEVSSQIWIFLNVLFLSISLYLLWGMLFDPSNNKSLILTLGVGFLFGNTLTLISLGQSSAILLLSLVISIWCLDRRLFVWVGVALMFLMIKPQVTYLVIATILMWAIRNRRWKLLLGFFITGLIVVFSIWLIFPNWLSVYINTVISIPSMTIYYSTIGSFIEFFYGISVFKYIGVLLLPFSFLLSKYVEKAGWLTILNIAILISIPLAPYGFSFDHVLLLPAIVQLVSWIWNKKIPVNLALAIGIGLVLCYSSIFFLIFFPSSLPYFWLVWPSIGLAVIYLIAYLNYKG